MLDKYIVKFRVGLVAQLTPEAVTALRLLPDVEYIGQDHGSQHFGQVVSDEVGAAWPRTTMRDFGGRAHQVKSYIRGSNVDDNGHGTHTAGTVGSTTYGVDKQAQIYGVKVSNAAGQFAYSDLVAAYDCIAADALKTTNVPTASSSASPSAEATRRMLNDAADGMVAQGFFVAAAAGNSGVDTSHTSPASTPSVCTVSGSNSQDYPHSDANHGPTVDIIAPAVNVYSTRPRWRLGLDDGHLDGDAARGRVWRRTWRRAIAIVLRTTACAIRLVSTASKDIIYQQFRNTVNSAGVYKLTGNQTRLGTTTTRGTTRRSNHRKDLPQKEGREKELRIFVY